MKISNAKGYLVMSGSKILSPVFGNEVSASMWLCRKAGVKKHIYKTGEGVNVGGTDYRIVDVDVTFGLLELLKLDKDLNE